MRSMVDSHASALRAIRRDVIADLVAGQAVALEMVARERRAFLEADAAEVVGGGQAGGDLRGIGHRLHADIAPLPLRRGKLDLLLYVAEIGLPHAQRKPAADLAGLERITAGSIGVGGFADAACRVRQCDQGAGDGRAVVAAHPPGQRAGTRRPAAPGPRQRPATSTAAARLTPPSNLAIPGCMMIPSLRCASEPGARLDRDPARRRQRVLDQAERRPGDVEGINDTLAIKQVLRRHRQLIALRSHR